ncbi:period circadian protein homolog 2-like isoform X2 [Hyperolius riggenbachi]|uniref:period circadian protein homolog 2-like isoform X2 n=1 Tax=Hyperolius riggenbachi TaxID=752182 RepID=UPI0035A28003
MPNQSKDFEQDLSLPRLCTTSAQGHLSAGLHLQSTEILNGQHEVSFAMPNTSLHFKQGGPVLQGFNASRMSPPQNLMPCLQESPLIETAGVSPPTPGHPRNDCSSTFEPAAMDRNCGSFLTRDSVTQQHYATLETLLTDLTARSHEAEDLNSNNQSGDPASSLQEDMETCNDSSSNDLNESDENGKEPASKSSNAFSLMMADSEHNPSTSGYSSEQPAKAKTQKELLKILKELRSYLPPEKGSHSKSCTAASLRYALHCIQQVKANEEYHQLLMINDDQQCGRDLSCYTVEEIANITSEYTKNNLDVFAVAVSLITGQILYISEQASVVLRCSADLFSHVRFVELLAPQDVSVFYSSTDPHRLPSWSVCNGGDPGYLDGLEEKSFYCRISCGRESRREVSYHPFRLTPYLIRVQTESEGGATEQLCCVLFAERVHSGYEAPRIPADKRIFTTTHTPSCLFQDVDERAVPLLGYLPQDLIGSPIILHVHPSDRPLMLAVHKKILQCGGQPFDFSPMRFCTRNGEYVTIDTSWSSFINPWSRKVSFIIGRHKVRMGPVNEDVFTAPPCLEDRSLQPEVQELTEQIHQLLMQPVHNSGSSGYGSLGSNGSHEIPMSGASSSDSNGNANDDVKEKHASRGNPVRGLKGQLGSSSLVLKAQRNVTTTPETGIADKASNCHKDVSSEGSGAAACPIQGDQLPAKQPPYSYQQISCLDSVIRYLDSCSALSSNKKGFMSTDNTSSLAFHDPVQMQDNVELEDGPSHAEVPLPAPAYTEKEPYKQLGLTKEVLVAHTQKEENDFLSGFMDSKKLSAFQTRCKSYMHDRAGALRYHGPAIDPAVRRNGKARKSKVKRVRPESWDSSSSGVPQAHRSPIPGLSTTAWSQTEMSHTSYPPLPYPVLPAFPLPVFPPPPIPVPNDIPSSAPSTTLPMQPFPTPLLSPMVALVLPNYMYPPGMPPAVYPAAAPQHPFPVPPSLYTPQPNMTASNSPFPVPQHTFQVPQPTFPVAASVYPPAQHAFTIPQSSCAPPSVQTPCPVQQFSYPAPPSEPKMKEGISRSSTPRDPQSPPLFQSRCSSPLQLNLLQLEESQRADRSEGGTGGALNGTFMSQTCEDPELHAQQPGSPADAHYSDALSTGSDLMDILLQEDASSGTCSASSAASESLTSGSHVDGTSGSQTGSSQTSRSSKYFASVDSSENTHKARGSTQSAAESVMKYVLQDPMWLLMANADENVMMTYQIPLRDMDAVLREDRDRLKSMQKLQPRFTEDQRKELGEIHPWIQRGGLPWAEEVAGCVFCKDRGTDCTEYCDTIQALELSDIMESCD